MGLDEDTMSVKMKYSTSKTFFIAMNDDGFRVLSAIPESQ